MNIPVTPRRGGLNLDWTVTRRAQRFRELVASLLPAVIRFAVNRVSREFLVGATHHALQVRESRRRLPVGEEVALTARPGDLHVAHLAALHAASEKDKGIFDRHRLRGAWLPRNQAAERQTSRART